jgi:poly(hydroxyalkanoate) depolymerase family esterase
MLNHLLAPFRALLARLRNWVLARLGKPRGAWIEGSVAVARGRLGFAPWAGNARPYRLYLPPGIEAGRPAPLWLWLHGCRQSPESFATGTRIARAADQAGALVLLPRQLRRANPFRCWNWFDRPTQQGRGEAAIVIGMIEAVAAGYAIDPQRVYVAGLSAGAALAAVLASCYPEHFAAVAMHSGVAYGAAQSPLVARAAISQGSSLDGEASAAMARLFAKSDLPVPALVVHGTADEAVPPLHAPQVVAHFLALNRLGEDGGRRYTATTWRQGGRLLARQVLIDQLGHAWSGGDDSEEYHDSAGPDATRLIVAFFQSDGRRAGP